MPARFVATSLVTKRADIAARFVTLVTKRAVVTKRAATGLIQWRNESWQSQLPEECRKARLGVCFDLYYM